ncbi:ankyrin [Rhizodiscina lignyota]|uniref:Ankyrin n=1 Tax=Rhizodiscina lignyota TaxID=1504668 RepID=A0A9P4MAS0_9PEZI|nr:ankyrin [Rhizodiscina lignyota]
MESKTPTIQVQAQSIAADIESFVRSEVKMLRKGYHGKKLFLYSDALEGKIIQTLTQKAEGMFLWVHLQLDSLCQMSNIQRDEAVEAALHTLPRGLDETYMRIVQQIVAQQEPMRELALRCLMWIFYAMRPLDAEELQHALATDEAFEKQEDIKEHRIEVILRACGNLLLDEGRDIRPVHYSVQEFFTRPPDGVAQTPFQQSLAHTERVHTILAGVCIKYMRLRKLDEPCTDVDALHNRLSRAPFLHYSTQYFDYHLRRCTDIDKNNLNLVEGLLNQGRAVLAALLQTRRVRAPDLRSVIEGFDPLSFEVSASTVVYATYLFEVEQVQKRWVGPSPPRYALHQASSAGVVDGIKRLLGQNANIDEKDWRGGSPLYYASLNNRRAAVEVLLDKGADVNAQGGLFGNALQAASYRSNEVVIKLLLDRGADVNAQGGFYGNALLAASRGGYELVAASVRGSETIVKLLLDEGADINAQGGLHHNALQAASEQGHEQVVKLLQSSLLGSES